MINPSNLSSEFWGDVTSYYEQLHDFRIPEFITKEIVDTIKQRDKCICGTDLKGPKSAIHIKHLEDFREKMTGASIATEAYAIKDTMRLAEENKPYKVLARKYRPQNFSDLRGQETMVKILQNAFAADRIAHSFILTGIRGTGKTTTARILAKGLNCVDEDGKEILPLILVANVSIACPYPRDVISML